MAKAKVKSDRRYIPAAIPELKIQLVCPHSTTPSPGQVVSTWAPPSTPRESIQPSKSITSVGKCVRKAAFGGYCLEDQTCVAEEWPAVFKPGDVIRGVVETNFPPPPSSVKSSSVASKSSSTSTLFRRPQSAGKLTPTIRSKKSSAARTPSIEDHVGTADGLWVIIQGTGVVHETETPSAPSSEPVVVSGYNSLPKMWNQSKGFESETYLKVKKGLWLPWSKFKTGDYVSWSDMVHSKPVVSESSTSQAATTSDAEHVQLQPEGSYHSTYTRYSMGGRSSLLFRTSADRSAYFPRKARFRFQYKLPSKNLPQTFFGLHGKISYWIIVIVQGMKPVWTMQRVVVQASQDAAKAHPECFKEYITYADQGLSCCFRSRGVVETVVKLPRTAFSIGEAIPVTTIITNSSDYWVQPVTLFLYQRILYYWKPSDDSPEEERRLVKAIVIEGAEPSSSRIRKTYFQIRPDLVPSDFGSYKNPPALMALDYWLTVEVKASTRIFQTQFIVVPIKLGTHFSSKKGKIKKFMLRGDETLSTTLAPVKRWRNTTMGRWKTAEDDPSEVSLPSGIEEHPYADEFIRRK